MTDVPALLSWLEGTALATRVRESALLFPLLESTHVIGLALVLGTTTTRAAPVPPPQENLEELLGFPAETSESSAGPRKVGGTGLISEH